MNNFHFSTTECFENCPYRFKLRYLDNIDTYPTDDPQNPLRLGTAIHKGMETDVQTALNEYYNSYNVIDDRHITEAIKIEYWINKMKKEVPEGLHEVNFKNEVYEGTADLLVPCTKHDAELPHGQFDLYDYKYSNNIDHYMQSRQLHVYRHMIENITGKKIRKMYFVFVPKVMIKQKKTETLEQFRIRLRTELEKKHIQIKEVIYDQKKVDEFYQICMHIALTKEFKKNESYLCQWCEYNNYCLKGDKEMILPSSERRTVGQTTKRKLWIYGEPMSGKTYLTDKFPSPLNLNTDGNIQFVTMPFIPIKDTMEGRQKVLAWKNFKDAIDELEKSAGKNGFKTIVVDLLEDTYESCRLYMYDKLGITHESDDSFRAWDKVRTEFLSTIRRLVNLDYENIILLSHEDKSKDITKKSGDKVTAIKPNISDKIANKVAGMVDIVCRTVKDNDEYVINFKTDSIVFGGGRLRVPSEDIPNTYESLVKVYDEANGISHVPSDENIHQEENKPVENKRSGRTQKVYVDEMNDQTVDPNSGEVVSNIPDQFLEPIESDPLPEEFNEQPKRRSRKQKDEPMPHESEEFEQYKEAQTPRKRRSRKVSE